VESRPVVVQQNGINKKRSRAQTEESDEKTDKRLKTEKELFDEEQIRLMDEVCIVVDENDKVLRDGSKRECHQCANIYGKDNLLHRAFSVFLFNSKNELLLQQRSHKKITFPHRWTNTCCSHPLAFEKEMEEKNHLGVKHAAIRKLEHELGIDKKSIELDELNFITRIHYDAKSDETWGEHEIDHILIVRKDVETNINLSEVEAIRYVTPTQLRELIADNAARPTEVLLSPWFAMIAEKFLFPWWDKLETIIEEGGIGLEEASKIYKLKLELDETVDEKEQEETPDEEEEVEADDE